MKNSNLLKMITLSMLVATGIVISPILRVEGLCPMAHFINIVASVLLGPYYSLLNAFLIAVLRMSLMGIPPLAITGAVFGAFFSGVFYRLSKGSIWAAVLGEITGTGIIGSIVSYPVMALLMGRNGLTWMFYTPSFILATFMGGSIAYIFLNALKANGMLYKIQYQLGVQKYEKSKSLFKHNK